MRISEGGMSKLLSQEARLIISAMKTAGYEIFPVGGFVRDFLLGLPCKDVDFTTNATTTQIIEVFSEYKTVTIGERYGTIGVIVNAQLFEITTYRTDGEYSDNRHPETVVFSSSLPEDLRRRDFTINAMAYDNGNIIDFFGGSEDIKQKQIRTVGDANLRFREDALRILRALRFAATLNFTIEEKTKLAMLKNANLLRTISSERIRDELVKILLSSSFLRVFMEFTDIFCVFMPEIAHMQGFQQNTKYHVYDVYEHTAHVVANSPAILTIRLAALFHDIGKPHTYTQDVNGVGHFKGHAKKSVLIAKEMLNKLRFEKKIIREVLLLVEYHDVKITCDKPAVKRALNRLTPPLFFDLIELKKADLLGKNPEYFSRVSNIDEIKDTAVKIIESGECYSLSQLAISGSDLTRMGISGEKVGVNLHEALNLVIDERVENEKNKILSEICNFL